MPLQLLKYGLGLARADERHLPGETALKKSYDVVIVGGGGHGLAAAYYLAKAHGIRNVAVIEKGYLGGGNTARNTAIVRSNYLTPEGVRFYGESMKLFEAMSDTLGINVMYSTRGHLTLAHTDSGMRTMRWRAEVNKHMGVESEVIGPDDIARIAPQLDLSRDARWPVLGALHHPVGSTARHDAVAWGYAREAAKLGVEMHQQTEVTGFEMANGKIKAVETSRVQNPMWPSADGGRRGEFVGCENGRRAVAHPLGSLAGVCVAAPKAVLGPDHRFGLVAHLHLAEPAR